MVKTLSCSSRTTRALDPLAIRRNTRNMALSVSGFPEPIRPTEPNADPSLERSEKTTESQDVVKNFRSRPRFFGSQAGLNKLADSIIHSEFSHSSLGPLCSNSSAHHYSFDPSSILPDLFPNPLLANRFSVVSRLPTANFIPAYVYTMSADAEFDTDAHQESQQPVSTSVSRKPVEGAVSPALTLNASSPRVTVDTPTRRDAAIYSALKTGPIDPASPIPPLPSPTPNTRISTSPPQTNSPAPNIPSPFPTTAGPAPSKSPAAPGSPSSRPNISINTAGLSNPLAPASLQQPILPQSHTQPPPSQNTPNSRVLIPAAAKRNPSPQNRGGINLRYQSMAIVDPGSSNSASSSRMAKGDRGVPSSTRKSSQGRTHRSKASPAPRANTLEAIPNSWASASRPSDLRPVYPSNNNIAQPQALKPPPRTGASLPVPPRPPSVPATPPRAARPNVVRYSRSRSADRTHLSSRVAGPRMPRQPVPQLAQPTPKRLSLGMVMNTSKLVSASTPAASIQGPSISSLSSSLPKSSIIASSTATKVLPIRSIPSSPTGSPSLSSHVPAIARLPISGSPDWKRETSPPPTSPPYRSAPLVPPTPFRAWPGSATQPASPVSPSSPPRALPPVSHSPSFRSAPIVPLSPFSSSSLQSPRSTTPAIAITSPTTATASTATPTTSGHTTSPVTSPASGGDTGVDVNEEEEQEVLVKGARRTSSPDSPTSVLSYASVTIFTKRKSASPGDGVKAVEEEGKELSDYTHILQSYPRNRNSNDPELDQYLQHLQHRHHHIQHHQYLDEDEDDTDEDAGERRIENSQFNPGRPIYEWGLEEIGHYSDQLIRFPATTTTTTTSSDTDGEGGPVVEVFVDNVYYDEMERSPSPIIYARPRGSDSDYGSDDEYGAARRRRAKRMANDANNKSDNNSGRGASRSRSRPGKPTRPALGPDSSVPSAFLNAGGMGLPPAPTSTGGERSKGSSNDTPAPHSAGGAGPASPISYHSDDSSLNYYAMKQPRRKRREQLRSYRYSFRPPVPPSSPPGPSPISPQHLAPLPNPNIIAGGEGRVGSPRSPSPILYARRRSLDFIADSDSDINSLDETGGTQDIGSWWGGSITPYGFLSSQPVGAGVGRTTTKKVKRRTVQPRSFLHEYSTPPEVPQPFADDVDERERKEKAEKGERERGRKRERALIPMPLANYNRAEKERERERDEKEKEKERKEKEKEKDKPRARKTSRGIFDELAAVAARNTISTRKQTQGTTSTTNTTSAGNSRSRSPKNKEKRKWVWDLNVGNSSSKDKSERVGDSSTSGSTTGHASAEGGLGGSSEMVLDIGGSSGHGHGGVGGTYDDWSAEWDESPTTGTRKKRKQKRHSLAGLEFL